MPLKAPDPVDVHIGGRIRLARMAIRMSQERLGEHLGLTFQQVQKYEKGANRVGGSRLWAISKALDVEPGYFFEGLDDEKSEDRTTADAVATVTQYIVTPEGLKLALRFMAIKSMDTRRSLLDLIGTVASKET